MTKYVVKRVLLAILTVFIVCAITFFAMNAIPGGPFDGEKAISDEVRRVLEQRFNLDKPVWEQFFLYLNNLLHGDFGVSAKTGREISWDRFCHAGNVCIFYRRKSRVPYVLQKSREKTCKGTEKALPL